MTDADVLNRVDEVNDLKTKELSLERNKKLIQQEIKSLQTQMDEMFSNIAQREEPREVECDVVFDYENRVVEEIYKGEVMSSRKMSEWEYSNRPEDIYPAKKANKEEVQPSEGKTQLQEAIERAEEIVTKTSNMAAQSANVNAFSEAKTEKALEGINV